MIGRMHHVVMDCPDPDALATFYSELLGLPVTYRDSDWVVVAASETTSGLAFQRSADHRPPTWPDPTVPQQVHLDIMVEDLVTAAVQVLALGAARRDGEDVYADPAGHLFCLVRRPPWASPIPDGGRACSACWGTSPRLLLTRCSRRAFPPSSRALSGTRDCGSSATATRRYAASLWSLSSRGAWRTGSSVQRRIPNWPRRPFSVLSSTGGS